MYGDASWAPPSLAPTIGHSEILSASRPGRSPPRRLGPAAPPEGSPARITASASTWSTSSGSAPRCPGHPGWASGSSPPSGSSAARLAGGAVRGQGGHREGARRPGRPALARRRGGLRALRPAPAGAARHRAVPRQRARRHLRPPLAVARCRHRVCGRGAGGLAPGYRRMAAGLDRPARTGTAQWCEYTTTSRSSPWAAGLGEVCPAPPHRTGPPAVAPARCRRRLRGGRLLGLRRLDRP